MRTLYCGHCDKETEFVETQGGLYVVCTECGVCKYDGFDDRSRGCQCASCKHME